VAAAPEEERGDPTADALLTQADREALPQHPGDDQADARSRVEPPLDDARLGCLRAHQHGGESGAGAAAAGVESISRYSMT